MSGLYQRWDTATEYVRTSSGGLAAGKGAWQGGVVRVALRTVETNATEVSG